MNHGIQEFIQSELLHMRNLTIEECVGVVDEMIGVQVCRNPACGKESHPCENTIHNAAITKVLTALAGLKV